MRYDNSLTSNVQNYIANSLAKKVLTAQNSIEISGVARDIRNYLCDQSTLNTPDFVIRRYIQKNKPDLLPPTFNVPNLTDQEDAFGDEQTNTYRQVVKVDSSSGNTRAGSNCPWPEEALNVLAKKLFDRAKERGTNISKKEWDRYLHGKGVSKREKAYQIAFTLDMDVDSTIDLFLSLDMEPYSVRYPLDLICLFCQHDPGKYTWADAEHMLNEFLQHRDLQDYSENTPTQGMTRQITSELQSIFALALPEADAQKALIKYMVDNSGEFVFYKETTLKARRDSEGKLVKDNAGKTIKDEVIIEKYLHGFSLSRKADFLRLTEYLAILYPLYQVQKETRQGEASEPSDTGVDETVNRFVRNKDGKINLNALVRSMFYNSGWSDIVWKKNSKPTNEEDRFDEAMRIFCQNYWQHIYAVSKTLQESKEDQLDDPKDDLLDDESLAFFDRNDALVFIYFLINGYKDLLERCDDESSAEYKQPASEKSSRHIPSLLSARESYDVLEDMFCSETGCDSLFFDAYENTQSLEDMFCSMYDVNTVISEALDKAALFFNSNSESLSTEHFKSLVESFNLILTQLGYTNLYLPARFDRFVVLSLLSATPDELTPLIMCQEELDYYESSN